jgi:hypothetical protein
MTNDYIIAVDETGQPFIAHAKKYHGYKSGQLLDSRDSVLYYKKVKLPNGKYRYFYTRRAYEAYLKNQSKDKTSPKTSSGTTKKSLIRPKILPKNWKGY